MKLSDKRRQAAEDEFAAGFAKALSYVQRRVAQRAAQVATTLVAAATPDDSEDDGHDWGAVLPLSTATASVDPAAVYDPAWWRRGYKRYVSKQVGVLYSSTVDRAGAELGVEFDPDDPTISDGLDELDDSTADAWGAGLDEFVQKQVRAGVAEGDSVDGLASRLRDSEDSWFGAARAALLASVAVATTYNRATLAAGTSARVQGTSSTKRWTSVGDERVRPSHVDMDGVEVDIGEDFMVSGAYPAAGPHDERLPPDETCNCRCWVELVSDGGSVDDETTSVGDDGVQLDYATDGSEEDALVASTAQLHTHGHCTGCGAWLEGRKYCHKCGNGYSGPLLEAGTEAPPPAEPEESEALSASHNRQLQTDSMTVNEDVGLVATDGVDQEDARDMTTIAPHVGVTPANSADTMTVTVQPLGLPLEQAAQTVRDLKAHPGDFADAGIGMVAWRGVIAVEGRPTGDGRMFRTDSLYWDDGYLPADVFAMLQDPDGGVGHDGSSIAGRMDRLWKQPSADGNYTEVWAEGFYDTSTPTGAEVLRLQNQGMLTGVSVDVDSVEVVLPDLNPDDMLFDMLFGGGVEEYSAGRIRRVTVCSIPAFIEARIYPVSNAGALVASAASEGFAGLRSWLPVENTAAERMTLVASALPAVPAIIKSFGSDNQAGGQDESLQDRKGTDVARTSGTFRMSDASRNPGRSGSGGRQVFHSPIVDGNPPAEVFAKREYTEYTPYIVDADGRLSGHVTPWGECHIGYAGRCVTAPRSSSGYLHARTGRVLTGEGDVVATARVFAQFGHGRAHAPEELAAAPAVEWYESQALAVADVAVYEDKFGIQAQGMVRPGTTRAQVFALGASRISPDWRSINGALDCVALAVVNVSGFTTSSRLPALVASASEVGVDVPDLVGLHAAAFIADGEVRTLIASGGPSNDPTLALTGMVQSLAARVDELEQAELGRLAAAALVGLPSAEDEHARFVAEVAALLDGVDLSEPAPDETSAVEDPDTAVLSAEDLATLRAALAITERLSGGTVDAAAGDTISCPNCQADVPIDAAGGPCPVCGEPIPADAGQAAGDTVTAAACSGGCGDTCSCEAAATV